MSTYDGEIEIELAEFWQFVSQFVPNGDHEHAFGEPIFDQSNHILVVPFAASSASDPREWSERRKPDWLEKNKPEHT